MHTALLVIIMYTFAVLVFCGIEYKCYYRNGKFLWRGFMVDCARIWGIVPFFILGGMLDAFGEVIQGCRKLVTKFKED